MQTPVDRLPLRRTTVQPLRSYHHDATILPFFLTCVSVLACLGLVAHMFAAEYISGKVWPEPKVIDPGNGKPPCDAIVLFDGKDLSKWNDGDKWIVKDGAATSDKTNITTKQAFGDCQTPRGMGRRRRRSWGSSQGRGNSGVFLMNIYELQILDSYDNKTYFDGQCGSIYKQWPPLVNACRKPGEWQTYDIVFDAPKFDKAGKVAQAGLRHRAPERRAGAEPLRRSSAQPPGTGRRPTRPTPTRCRSNSSITATR